VCSSDLGFVVSGSSDRDRLTQVAKLVYDESEKLGGDVRTR
jgi:hypothetical protein